MSKISATSHWCRIVMDQTLRRFILNLDFENFSVLEISGNSWSNFGFKDYSTLFYPEFDICNIPTENFQKYDLVILEQVLEHVHDPNKALSNIKRLLNPAGLLLITTPFMIKLHGDPYDFWRWTPTGLKQIIEEHNYRILELNTWGNKDCLIANLDKWAVYKEGMNLENDPTFALVVWCIAQNV